MNTIKKLSLVSLAALLSCSTTYAKRDYDQYPEYKDEIALHNLTEITKNVCSPDSWIIRLPLPRCESMNFNERMFEYNYKQCESSTSYPVTNMSGQTKIVTQCSKTFITTHNFYWDKITKIVPNSQTVEICHDQRGNCVDIGVFKDEQQASDFAQAINIYRKTKK